MFAVIIYCVKGTKVFKCTRNSYAKNKNDVIPTHTECVSESGDFATLFFLVQQHWGGCSYCHFADNFKAF